MKWIIERPFQENRYLLIVDSYPICSMYGIFTYFWAIYGVNGGTYSSTMDPMGMGNILPAAADSRESECGTSQEINWLCAIYNWGAIYGYVLLPTE